ncbi:MAG TPA: beta-N-acetylhexosaminidase [Feifaniaceae bacterium]|nr:beta-N-acetylhexosaminidase [Feifaniaceae bacterium]
MPIPMPKQYQPLEGPVAFQAKTVCLDPALERVREGILAMLALAGSVDEGSAVRFVKNDSLGREAYALTCDEKGVLAEAGGEAGAVHAAAAIAQLALENGGVLPACTISDEPRFGWRGLTLDVCRHSFPMRTVKQLVDLLAFYRFNRLHLHLSDDQGFRFESERFPLLNAVGSRRESTLVRRNGRDEQDGIPHSGYHTKAELRELVAFCKARGVEIVPEIDMPGHALAMIASYPELACFMDEQNPVHVATSFGVSEFSKVLLCAGNEKTFDFIFALLDEVMEIFPFEYFHLGGDEAVKDEWKRCPKCQKVLHAQGLKNEHELQGWLISRVSRYLASRGKKTIIWNDGLCKSLDPGIVCQYWRPFLAGGKRSAAAYANAGERVIGSDFLHMYFDYPYAATPLKKTFYYEPVLKGVKKACRGNIVGMECAVWTEWIDTEEKLFFNALPRLAAAAEAGWSSNQRRSYRDFTRRLAAHYKLYDRLGLTSAKNAEKTLPLWTRIRIAWDFLKRNTHIELPGGGK